MGFFFSLGVAVLPNARTFLLKIEGQLEDQKDDVFLVSLIALKIFFILHEGLHTNLLSTSDYMLGLHHVRSSYQFKKKMFFFY